MMDKPVDDGWRIPDELWAQIEPLLPPKRSYPKGGRPRMPDRQAMDAICSVLRTGCQWKALPRSLGASSTVHDRFQDWREDGVFERMGRAGLLKYEEEVGIEWEWQAMDGAMTKLNRFRRLLIRWEKKVGNYLAMLHFACAWITFRAARVFG